jgi:uncharacterized peroxidase-related enzyme
MRPFDVPQKHEVSDQNKQILEDLESKIGFVPNIYATYAYSDTALGRYLTFSNAKTSLSNKEKEVVNLVVSQVNGCTYCQAAHTQMGKMNGYSDDQILEIRSGKASFDAKTDALVSLTKAIIKDRGQIDDQLLADFFNAGYTKENLVDVIVAVGDKTTTNLLHNVTQIPVDFPEAPALEETALETESA